MVLTTEFVDRDDRNSKIFKIKTYVDINIRTETPVTRDAALWIGRSRLTWSSAVRRSVPAGDTAVGLGAEQLGAGRGPGVVRAGPGQAGELHRGGRQRPRAGGGLPARGAAGPAHVGRGRAAHVPERVRAQRRRRGGQEQLPGGRHHQPVARVRRVQRVQRRVRRAQVPEVRVRQRRQQVRPAVRRGHQRGALEVQFQ